MVRTMSALLMVTLAVATIGCARMCSHPLDYYGPVYCGGTHPPGAQNVRAGSILSEPMVPPMDQASAQPARSTPQGQVARQASEDKPVNDRLLSVADKKVEPAATTLPPPPKPETTPPASKDGWVAMRPDETPTK
jgi:hypothetical protein